MADDARKTEQAEELHRLLERLSADQGRAAEGNRDREAAWSALRGVLHRMSRSSVRGDEDEREDAVQAVCVKLQNPGTLALVLNARSPGRYLMSALRNAFVDMFRLKRRDAFKPGPRREPRTGPAAAANKKGIQAVSVGDEEGLQSALNELSGENRDLFLARYVDRRSLEAIASNVGISKQAVSARLHRIKRRLRRRSAGRGGKVTAMRPQSGTKVRVERLRAVWAAWNTEGHPWHPLAKTAGISHATISRILTRGSAKTVRTTTLKKLAQALRVPVEWLTGERRDLPHVPEWDYSDATRAGPSRWEKPTARDVQWSWLLQSVEDAIKRDLREWYGEEGGNAYDAWGNRILDVIAHLCDLRLWRRATLFADAGRSKDDLFVLRWLEHLLGPWLEGKAKLKTELLGEVFKALLTEDVGFEFLAEDEQAKVRDAAVSALQQYEQEYYNSWGPDED